jgi:hypothetical protein
VERRHAVAAAGIRIGALLQQRAHGFAVAPHRGIRNWRSAARRGRDDRGQRNHEE